MSETITTKFTKKPKMYYVVHMIVLLALSVGIAFFSNEIILDHAWNKQYMLFAGMFYIIMALCSFIEREHIYTSARRMGILIACFAISGLLLLLSDFYINLPVWLLGGIIAAALVSRNVGMIYLYYFVFHAIYLQGNWMSGLVFHFVITSLIAFFIPKMKTFCSMLYMMAFASCIILTGSVIHNQMVIDETMLLDTFYILCTYLGCIMITMLLVKWNKEEGISEETLVQNNYEYLDLLAQDTAIKDAEAAIAATAEVFASGCEETAEPEKTMEPEKEIKPEEKTCSEDAVIPEEVTIPEENMKFEERPETEEPAKTEEITEGAQLTENETTAEPIAEVIPESVSEPIDYTPYCDESSELLQQLRRKDKASYARALLVGKFASATAAGMGLDKDLTKAAGLYKFIGKIRENNTEYTATEIAKENNFPEPLIYLLDQINHNIVEQKEAAVILITYGVISNYSMIRGAQKNVPVERIVDTVVSKKIFQGEFNECGLNVQECYILRKNLIALLTNQDKKYAVKQTERK